MHVRQAAFPALLLVVALAALPACVHVSRPAPAGRVPAAAVCRTVVDAAGRPADASMRWHEIPERGRAGAALAAACATVGPSVYEAPAASAGGRAIDRLAIVSWNVHVGGGDVGALVAALREGRLTGGEPVADFVLLLHEAFRGGDRVPTDLPAGVSVPRRIAPGTPSGRRIDVVRAARGLGLGVFYVPSMRNGDDEGPAEDRGNAILSTLSFDALAGVELPYARQRRVAIGAVVHGVDSGARPWRLRLVSAHLNATAGADRLWIFASGLRERQSRHLIDALGEDATPTVVGSDLNTWAGGFREAAFVELQRRFPESDAAAGGAMFRGGPRLDFVFFGLPASWEGRARPFADRFGSDHHPIVGWISVHDG